MNQFVPTSRIFYLPNVHNKHGYVKIEVFQNEEGNVFLGFVYPKRDFLNLNSPPDRQAIEDLGFPTNPPTSVIIDAGIILREEKKK